MNNKGFGLSELIIFIVASLITLVVVVIVYDQNFGHVEHTDYGEVTQIIGEETTDYKEEIKEKEKEKIGSKKYKDLEEKILNSSKMYVSDKYTGKIDKITIKLSTLIEGGYLDQLIDPDDSTIVCTGYVIYNGEFYYEPYIRCGDNYKTDNYNVEFE